MSTNEKGRPCERPSPDVDHLAGGAVDDNELIVDNAATIKARRQSFHQLREGCTLTIRGNTIPTVGTMAGSLKDWYFWVVEYW